MSEETSFWKTAPGVITAISGLFGSIAALVTALYGAGFIGGKEPKPKEPDARAPVVTEPEKFEPPVVDAPVPKKAPPPPPNASHPPLSAANTSTYLGNKTWGWTIYIDAPADVLATIECVTYTLHSTFQLPPQVVCDPSSRFSYAASGWGVFLVPIEVTFKDGTRTAISHQLQFGQ